MTVRHRSVVPGEVLFDAPGVAQPVLGHWHPADNRIALLEWVANRTSLVRHGVIGMRQRLCARLQLHGARHVVWSEGLSEMLLVIALAIFFVPLGLDLIR